MVLGENEANHNSPSPLEARDCNSPVRPTMRQRSHGGRCIPVPRLGQLAFVLKLVCGSKTLGLSFPATESPEVWRKGCGKTPRGNRYRGPRGHERGRRAIYFDGVPRARRASIRSSVRAIFLIGEIDGTFSARPRRAFTRRRRRLQHHRRAGASQRHAEPERDYRRHRGAVDDPFAGDACRRSDGSDRPSASRRITARLILPPAQWGTSRWLGAADGAIFGR